MVDLSGDGYGNYMLVRSAVSPYFKRTDLSTTGIGYARALVGHQYQSGQFKRSVKELSGVAANASSLLLSTTPISNRSSCFSGTGAEPISSTSDEISCSVKNPKTLMSSSGRGIVLFHQNQKNNYQSLAASATPTNPNRLWYTTYSTSSGFSSPATLLDDDLTCSATSIGNDASVCELGSYSVACQTLGEPVTAHPLKRNDNATAIDHALSPIAAAMNSSGRAVVAYHKKSYNPLTAGCGSVGTYVKTYDPSSGFSDAVQIDGQYTYDTLHAAVAISDAGRVAVVWEQIIDSALATRTIYLYLATKINGVWSSPLLINSGQADSYLSMMPSVGIRDNGEVLVTYSYGKIATTRKQYVKHYFYH
jgi:hypothetical protein